MAKKDVDRTARDGLFGFDFQANAAIVLMLDNIKEMSSIRLEGHEDIEINLEDGSYILAQAKAVRNSDDSRNTLASLKKSLRTLSEAASKNPQTRKLIHVTNAHDPLKVPEERHIFLGHVARRKFDSLPPKSKARITKILSEINSTLNTSLLSIYVIPFETDDDKERYSFILQEILDFLNTHLGISTISRETLHRIWNTDIFRSGTKKEDSIALSKKDIVWPIIVLVTSSRHFNEEDYEELDDSEIEEITRSYKDIINTCSERYEFVTKVLYAFNTFERDKKFKERKNDFIRTECSKFAYLFEGEDLRIPKDLQNKLLQIIIRTILNNRDYINNIKNAVNL